MLRARLLRRIQRINSLIQDVQEVHLSRTTVMLVINGQSLRNRPRFMLHRDVAYVSREHAATRPRVFPWLLVALMCRFQPFSDWQGTQGKMNKGYQECGQQFNNEVGWGLSLEDYWAYGGYAQSGTCARAQPAPSFNLDARRLEGSAYQWGLGG
jgi:hypothetical protein